MALTSGQIVFIVLCTIAVIAFLVVVSTYIYLRGKRTKKDQYRTSDSEAFLKRKEKGTPPLPIHALPRERDESGTALLNSNQYKQSDAQPHSPIHDFYTSHRQRSADSFTKKLADRNSWIPSRSPPIPGDSVYENNKRRSLQSTASQQSPFLDPFRGRPTSLQVNDYAFLPSPPPSQTTFPGHNRTNSSQSPSGSRSPRPPLSPLLIPGSPPKTKSNEPSPINGAQNEPGTPKTMRTMTTDSEYSQPSAWHGNDEEKNVPYTVDYMTAPPMPSLPQSTFAVPPNAIPAPMSLLADDNHLYSAYPAYDESPSTPSPVLPQTIPAFLESHRNPDNIVLEDEGEEGLQRAPTVLISKLLKQRMSRVPGEEEIQGADLGRSISKIERANSIRSAGEPEDGQSPFGDESSGNRRPKMNRLDIRKKAHLNRTSTDKRGPQSSHAEKFPAPTTDF